jgi:hypothetical protein
MLQNLPIMLYWECKRRLQRLERFRALAGEYFSNISRHFGAAPTENDRSRAARVEMNLLMSEVTESAFLIGIPTTVHYIPPTRMGGLSGPLDILVNIFELWQFEIGNRQARDIIDRAIGAYQRERRHLLRQLFNPLFWIKWLLMQVAAVPFGFFSALGFKTKAFEQSVMGRIIKGVVVLVTFSAAFLTILDLLGWLDRFKTALHLSTH